MVSRFSISIGLALLLALVFAFPAFGGGWAVITLDELPTGVVAGEPLTIGFTVLQHGRTPMSGLDPTITANLYKEQEFVVHAEPDGEPGHYTATLTFPKEGEWRWSIQAFTMDQLMPTLSVVAPSVVSQPATAPKPVTVPWLMIVRGLVFGIAFIGLVVAFRWKSRRAAALTGLCLLIGIGTFITGATALEAEAQSKSASKAPVEASVSQVEMGRQLFIAKGCITCHYNSKAASSPEYWTIEMGAPNLTKFSGNEEVLRMRLKDPASVKSDTKMPNLGLKETEIEALIAFINSK
ncbi:MAG TPA: c-type cytochrome [Anaerolineales bacterium]|nr:c-type cytochrome [Anaerolineales bacterium]